MTDPREQPLNDVARVIMVQANYDPHFSGIEDRLIMETKLFLARHDALRQFVHSPDSPTKKTAIAIMDYCAARPTVDWNVSEIVKIISGDE